MEYEINFLVLQSHTESLEKVREKVRKVISSHQGSVVDTLEYKKRKLAFEISHEIYGFYTVFRFNTEDPTSIETIKKDLNLVGEVARYIIVRTDELLPLQKVIETAKKETPAREKTTIRQEDVEKILAGEKTENDQKKKETTGSKPENIRQAQKAAPTKESATEQREQKSAKDSPVKEKKQEDTLEDLDKKLDEILNI